MKLSFLLFLFLICCSLSAFCQRDTVYLRDTFFKLPSRQNASYYRLTSFAGPNRQQRTITTYFLSGQKYSEDISLKNEEGKFQKSTMRHWHQNGQLKEEIVWSGNKAKGMKWHENGQVYYQYEELDKKKNGEALGYYPNGNLRRRELFKNGALVKGECFNEDGSPMAYYPHVTPVEFPGGIEKLRDTWIRNFKIPPAARARKERLLVVVQFEVLTTGEIGKVEVVQSDIPALEEEAMKAAKFLPICKPATEEGVAIKQTFTLPTRVWDLDLYRKAHPKK